MRVCHEGHNIICICVYVCLSMCVTCVIILLAAHTHCLATIPAHGSVFLFCPILRQRSLCLLIRS